MKTRCPTCGAGSSLDVLIAHEDARALIIGLSQISDELTKAALRYLTLFRPANRDLSFDRVAKLLNQLLPDIQSGQITRNRQIYEAPRPAWIWAFNKCIEARDTGKLKTPLTTHGFLYETIKFYQPVDAVDTVNTNNVMQINSKLRQGIAAIAEWAHDGDFLKGVLSIGLGKLFALNLSNKPAAADLIAVAKIWHEELLNQRKDWQADLDKKRIEKAFQYLSAHAEKWPNPKDLIQVMLPRPEQNKLVCPPLTEEQKKKNKKLLEDIKTKIGCK